MKVSLPVLLDAKQTHRRLVVRMNESVGCLFLVQGLIVELDEDRKTKLFEGEEK